MSRERPLTAVARLRMDYLRLKKEPVPYVDAEPLPSNILEWYYVVRGPEKSQYEGGYYLGRLVFPREYPFRPPSIYMNTPNGRFKTNTRLCLSISDFHPDTWNPAWSVATILTGLLSFMLERSPTFGSIECSEDERRRYARASLQCNIQDRTFCELFPHLLKAIKEDLARQVPVKAKETKESKTPPPAVGNVRTLIMDTIGGVGQGIRIDNGIYNALSNVFIVLGFAAFLYIVKYVMLNNHTSE